MQTNITSLLACDPSLKAIGFCKLFNGTPVSAFTLHHVTTDTLIDQLYAAYPLMFTDPPDELIIERPDCWTRAGKNTRDIIAISNISHILAATFNSLALPDRPRIIAHLRSVKQIKSRLPKHVTDFEATHIHTGIAHNEHERDALHLALWWWVRRGIELTRTHVM